jgi:hypothetical protein
MLNLNIIIIYFCKRLYAQRLKFFFVGKLMQPWKINLLLLCNSPIQQLFYGVHM